jgi:hypothetical protein
VYLITQVPEAAAAARQGEVIMKKFGLWGLLAAVCLAAAPAVDAANSVVVTSKTVATGATGVAIPVLLSNDVALRSITVPLVIREQTAGSFITSLTMGYAERLPIPGPLDDIVFLNHYADEDGTCKNGYPGGFGTITHAASGISAGPYAVTTGSPEGVLFARARIVTGDLPVGSDASGSIVLTVDVTSVDGIFEVDTTCTDPVNHLLWARTDNVAIVPTFTKGVITVGDGPQNEPPVAVCQNVTADANDICLGVVSPADVDNGSLDPDGDPITLALEPAGPYPLGNTPVRLIVTDDGGLADTCNATITVLDVTPPTITCPSPVSVECLEDIPPADVPSVTVSDNCDSSPIVQHVEDRPLTGGPCGGTIDRIYRATDASGNYRECTQTITVSDVTQPSITCPGPVTVECEADVPPADINSVTAADNCDVSPTISHVGDSPLSGGPCGGTITRTYRAIDDCGNFRECTQTITVDDTTPPSVMSPDPISVECEADVPPPDIGLVTASDNCGGTVTITWVSDSPLSGGPCGGTITRTYRATDPCGNYAEVPQVIDVDDHTLPSITCPDPITVMCAADVAPPSVDDLVVTDNCGGSVTATYERDELVDYVCTNQYILHRIYRATDVCGNWNECTQVITVDDNIPPNITICPPPTTVQCVSDLPPPNIGLVSASDNCGGPVTITHQGDTPLSGGPCGGTITRTYRASDECGNWNECTQVFTVDDTEDPVITSCQSDTTIDVEAPATGTVVTFSTEATDNCGSVTVECSPPSGSFFSEGTTTVVCVALDDCRNITTCHFNVTVNVISPCSCPNQCDIEPDGFITPLDLSAIIDILFASAVDIQDPGCPSPRFDFDCDGFTTPLDLSGVIDNQFASGPGPCDPCAP